MNVTMGQLVNDAKELVMRLKEREKNVDQVVIQSNALAKKVDAIQQVKKKIFFIQFLKKKKKSHLTHFTSEGTVVFTHSLRSLINLKKIELIIGANNNFNDAAFYSLADSLKSMC